MSVTSTGSAGSCTGCRGRRPRSRVGALGAAALPVTGGFVAEWTLLQALIHAARPGDRVVAATVPLALGVIALTAGLALLTFVKAFGIAFLARPRSAGADAAREVPVTMRVAMLAAAWS